MPRFRNQAILNMLCNTGDGVFIVGPDQRILRWNSGAERILKYSESEVLNRPCYEVIDGRTQRNTRWCQAQCKVRECSLTSTPLENFDLLARAKDGARIWTNISVIWSSDKRPLSVHLIRDVSDQKRVGEAARRFLADLGVRGRPRSGQPALKSPGQANSPRRAASGSGLPLSPREIEVLRLLAEGYSARAIAETLKISRFTVRNHTQNIASKLGVHNKTHAVAWAFKSGLV